MILGYFEMFEKKKKELSVTENSEKLSLNAFMYTA